MPKSIHPYTNDEKRERERLYLFINIYAFIEKYDITKLTTHPQLTVLLQWLVWHIRNLFMFFTKGKSSEISEKSKLYSIGRKFTKSFKKSQLWK